MATNSNFKIRNKTCKMTFMNKMMLYNLMDILIKIQPKNHSYITMN